MPSLDDLMSEVSVPKTSAPTLDSLISETQKSPADAAGGSYPGRMQLASLAHGATSATEGLLNTLGDIVDMTVDYGKHVGLPENARDVLYHNLAKKISKSSAYWEDVLNKEGASGVDRLIGDTLGGLPAGIAQWEAKVPGAILAGAAEAHKQGRSVISGAALEGAKRYILGGLLKYFGEIKNPVVRRGLSAITFGGAALTDTTDPVQVGIQTLMGGLMAGKEGESGEAKRTSDVTKDQTRPEDTKEGESQGAVQVGLTSSMTREDAVAEAALQNKKMSDGRFSTTNRRLMQERRDELVNKFGITGKDVSDYLSRKEVSDGKEDVSKESTEIEGQKETGDEGQNVLTPAEQALAGTATGVTPVTPAAAEPVMHISDVPAELKVKGTIPKRLVNFLKKSGIVTEVHDEGRAFGGQSDYEHDYWITLKDGYEVDGQGGWADSDIKSLMMAVGRAKEQTEAKLPKTEPYKISIKSPAIKTPDGKVFEGDSHPVIRTTNPDAKRIGSRAGFTTSDGRFVNRAEGAEIAKASGQIKDTKIKQLHSEHLKEAQAPEVMSDAGEGPTKNTTVSKFTSVRPAKPSVVSDVASNLMGSHVIDGESPYNILHYFHTGEIKKGYRGILGWLGGMAGESSPITTRFNQEVGEAEVRYLSAPVAAEFIAKDAATKVMETGVNPNLAGAVGMEDNLRGVREQLLKEGDKEGADDVHTLVGEGGYFKDEAEYQKAYNDPLIRETVARYNESFGPLMDELYKKAQGIAMDEELPTRGSLGMRLNMKAVLEGDKVSPESVGRAAGPGGGSLTATYKRKSPFARKAKGTAVAYDINLYNIIENTVKKQLEIAAKNELYDIMIKNGAAIEGKPGMQNVKIDGEETQSFPIVRRTIVSDRGGETKVIPQNKAIYIRKSLAGEFRRAANVDAPLKGAVIGKISKILNWSAITGLTDATAHATNLTTAMLTRPGIGGNALRESVAATGGFGNLAVVAHNFYKKAIALHAEDPAAIHQMAELARIGAMRPKSPHQGIGGRFLQAYDRTTRLVMDDGYQYLKSIGKAEDSETARREFINQVGQYNRRAQGKIMQALKDVGVSPFIIAGKTFTTMGIRNMMADPGVKGSSVANSFALRGLTAARFAGTVGTIMLLNYLSTKDKKGGIMGRSGTPLLSIDTGMDTSDGRPIIIPMGSFFGYSRAMRVTGLRGTIEGIRNGLTPTQAVQDGLRDIGNSLISPVAGPPVRVATAALFGSAPQIGQKGLQQVVPTAPPGSSQIIENLKYAALSSNPISFAWSEAREKNPKDLTAQAWTFFQRQLPTVTPRAGYDPAAVANMPEIVTKSEIKNFSEDVVKRSRKFSGQQKIDFLHSELNKVPDNLRAETFEKLKRDGAFIDDKDPLSFMRTPAAAKVKRMRELQVLAK